MTLGEKVHAVLTGADLEVGFSTGDPQRPITLKSTGGSLAMPLSVADLLLTAIEKEWGERDVHVLGLRAMINLARAA